MKIKFGAIVTDGRNKIGGHVASKNKGGNYLKTKSSPTNPNTSFQSTVRGNFGSLAQAWRGLTQAQRDTWNNGAASFPYTDIFGDTKILSGFGLYMQLNSNLNTVGAALLDDCPSPATVTGLTSIICGDVAGVLTLEFLPAPVPTGHALVLGATPGLSPGRAFSQSSVRQLKVLAAATATLHVFTNDYINRFGSVPAIEQNVYVTGYMVLLSTGQVSPAVKTLRVEP